MKQQPDVFLSFSHKDREEAARIRGTLEEAGLRVWSDDNDILPGADWGEHLRETMQKADVVIVLVTPASLDSAWVMSEIGAAIAARKHVIPLILSNRALPPGLPGPLRNWDFIRAGQGNNGEMMAEIRGRLESIPLTQPA